jgi:hypothetical protein
MYRDAAATEHDTQKHKHEYLSEAFDSGSESAVETNGHFDDLTRSFMRLTNLPSYPLDRLTRYEAMLWRQAYQTLFILRCLERRKRWATLRLR